MVASQDGKRRSFARNISHKIVTVVAFVEKKIFLCGKKKDIPMEAQRVDLFLMNNSENLPSGKMAIMRDRLKSLPEDRWPLLLSLNFKNPIIALVLSFLVGEFGIDRIYVGQVGLGLLKLISCGGFGLWWLIDLFLIMGAAKEENLKKVLMVM